MEKPKENGVNNNALIRFFNKINIKFLFFKIYVFYVRKKMMHLLFYELL